MGLEQKFKVFCLNKVFFLIGLIKRVLAFLRLLSVVDHQYNTYEYEGVRMGGPAFSKQSIDQARSYDRFRADDVIIVTYPKAGTHFTGDVIYSIYRQAGLVPQEKNEITMYPYLESSWFLTNYSMGFLDNVPSPRIIVTHLPWRFLPAAVKEHKVKVIHCRRNPKDVAASEFTFLKTTSVMDVKTTWDQYLDLFTSGKVVYGDYCEFMKDWYPHRNATNMLCLTYEGMNKDLRNEVIRIAKFLNVDLTDDQIQVVVDENTFVNRKKKVGNHFWYNKGKSGAWRSKFTVEQNDAMDAYIEDGLKGLFDLKIDYE